MPGDLPSLTALQAFDASLRHLSFTRAGTELGRTQGAVSRQVALLEQQLGVELFVREHRSLRATAAGRNFGDKLRVLLDRLSALVLETQVGGGASTALHLTILPTFGTRWLIPRMPSFYAEHPEVRVHLTTRTGLFDFDAEGFDAAIHHGPPNWPGAELVPLLREEVVVVAAAGLAEDARDPADLLACTLLRMESRPHAWRDWLTAAGVNAPPSLAGPMFEHHLMVIQAALAGLGVAILPSFLVEDELRAGTLRDLFPALRQPGSRAYYLAFPESKRDLPGLVAFRDWIERTLE